jgi:hypothetical protein
MHNLPIQCYASIHLGEVVVYKIAIESSSAERGVFHTAVECRCRCRCKTPGSECRTRRRFLEAETRRFNSVGWKRWLEYESTRSGLFWTVANFSVYAGLLGWRESPWFSGKWEEERERERERHTVGEGQCGGERGSSDTVIN